MGLSLDLWGEGKEGIVESNGFSRVKAKVSGFFPEKRASNHSLLAVSAGK
jgi:hypothetical protein